MNPEPPKKLTQTERLDLPRNGGGNAKWYNGDPIRFWLLQVSGRGHYCAQSAGERDMVKTGGHPNMMSERSENKGF